MFKQWVRRHVRQIAGVSGAAMLLTTVSILITGTEREPLLEPTALSIHTPSAVPRHDGLAGPSFTPSASANPSMSPSPTPSALGVPFEEIAGIPEAATVDQVNTAIGLAIGAILLALVAAGLAGVAIARQPAGGGDGEADGYDEGAAPEEMPEDAMATEGAGPEKPEA